MLTKIRPAALVAAFLFLSLYPIASNAGTPEPDNAFDWLKIVFNHTDPGNMDPGAITVLYDQADTLTAARPTFFDELKKIPKDDTNPDGPETIAMIKEGIERRLKEADFPQARKTHLTEVKGDWKKITLQDVFDALKAEKKKDDGEKEEDSPWTKWATAKNAPHAKNIQKALQELGKPAKSGDDTTRTPPRSSQHGRPKETIYAQNYANSLWDRIQANDEWKKLLGTTSEDEFKKLAQNLFKEKLDGPEGRIEAAKQLAEKHPGLLERWQALGDDEFKTALGFPRGDDRALALFGKKDDPGSYGLLGAREQTDEKLYSDIFDQSKQTFSAA
ncbi:MAG: hypothetical protein H6617_00245 [Bdellovibrionaceae bacterium]|nr:hypothetical protein [Pseudobdellovibrionaceae bacterium]